MSGTASFGQVVLLIQRRGAVEFSRCAVVSRRIDRHTALAIVVYLYRLFTVRHVTRRDGVPARMSIVGHELFDFAVPSMPAISVRLPRYSFF
jgi:hypothetical protein